MLSSVLSPLVSNNLQSLSLGGTGNQAHLVSWNPNTTNWFSVISGRDVNYYRIDEKHLHLPNDDKGLSDSNEHQFSSISTTSLQSEALCYSWSPECKEIFAVGLSNGSILLDNIQSDQHVFAELTRNDPSNRSKTSSPPCRCMDWNPVETNIIAAGYDKVPKQNCVAIWDINRMTSVSNGPVSSSTSFISDTESTVSSDYGGLSTMHGSYISSHTKNTHNSFQLPSRTYFTAKTVTRPQYELCPGEGASSISWLPGNASCFLLGTTLKYIRLFDLREYTVSSAKTYKPPKSFAVHNKSVLGIYFNPFDGNQFATFSEDPIIKLWDLRKMPNPVKELNVSSILPASSKTTPVISQIQWSNAHKNVMGILTKDSNTVKLCDLSEQSKTVKYKISNHKAVFSSSGSVTSFSFHPTVPRCMLLSTSSGLVQYTQLKDFVKFSISCHEDIVSSHFRQIIENNFTQPNDIMTVMKERAKRSIGIDVSHNLSISKELKDIDGIIIWSWVSKMRDLNKLNGRTQSSEYYYTGIQHILASSVLMNPTQDLGNYENILPFKPLSLITHPYKHNIYPPHNSEVTKSTSMRMYTSPQRSICLNVCGWTQEYLNSLKSVQANSELLNERSAAIAIFNLDIRSAANILGLLSDNDKRSNYMFLSYALGGYSESRREEFQHVFKTLYPKLQDPYLSAAFGFLTSEPKDPQCVLNQKAIPVSDRIAFACYYLNDEELGIYISELREIAMKTGDIQGIIITGLQSQDSLALMQRYVDRTCDVQIACLAFNKALVNRSGSNLIPDIWMESYRDLLDRWKMWEERAYLDISIQQSLRGESVVNHEGAFPNHAVNSFNGTAPSMQPIVSVKCAFCSQSLHHSSLLLSKGGRQAQLATKHGNSSSMPKSTSCPSCRKPLPKCSVCLMSFGSPSHSMGGGQTTEMDFCFSWCTRCKHGGHVKHMLDWFKTHEECPVSDCKCKCFSYL